MSISAQVSEPLGISVQLDLAFPDVPGFKGQGWSTQETMMVVRWLFANPDAWDQAMSTARAYPGNPHTVADTLHETIVPRSELDAIAAAGGDPAKVNWLEIGHELIERRDDPRPETVTAQLAAPVTISGQLDLSAASRQKAHDTASATAKAHWRADQVRDDHGRWARAPGGTADITGRFDEAQRGGRKPVTVKDILAEWRKSKDDLVRSHLNRAAAALDAGDRDAAVAELRNASTYAGVRGSGDRLHELAASLSDESRTNATVADFATKGAKAVTGLLGAGHNGWNGKIDLFNAEDQPAYAAVLNWDGTMQFQRELAQKMRDDAGGPVDDPQPYAVALHELIHGALPAGGESAEWKALAPDDRAALDALGGMDKANVSGGAYATMHSLADVRKYAPHVTQDTIDSLAGRGLLEKSDFTSSRADPKTGEWASYHEWKMTGKARDMTPAPQQTHAMHSAAYQNPTGASVEEGFTELGTVHHAPEFFAKMGIGDRPTKYTAFEAGHPKVNPVYASTKAAVFSKLADQERALSADPRGPQQQAAQAARRAVQSLNDDNLPGAEDDLAELRQLGDPDVTQAAKSIQAGLDKMQAAGYAARATMSEYAKRLRDPGRIAKGDAWRHYGWQTAAAQSWVQDAAKAEGKGPKSPRVRDLADEINREGVGGKVPAMVRQVIRAAGADPDKFQGAPFAALETRIRAQWPQGPDGAQSSPWASALAAVQDYDRSHP